MNLSPQRGLRTECTAKRNEGASSCSPSSRSSELVAVLRLQRHTKAQQSKAPPNTWPGFDAMGWEYEPLYEGLEWPPRKYGAAE